MAVLAVLTLVLLAAGSRAFAQDISPLKKHHIWLPMTGVTEQQMEDARSAGYDTIMLKVHPSVSEENTVDFASTDKLIRQAEDKGFKVLLAILGWVGLGNGRFWDVEEDGTKIPNQLDPFWPEAMRQVEWYYGQIIERYRWDPRVVGFAPTWGIYGEAGFTSLTAGRSEHALARFNEWLAGQGLGTVSRLPTRHSGPNTDFNRFVRFRYLYIERRFDEIVGRLKKIAGNLPVGMWQEMYPVIGYLWTMVEVPSADFALYESCFPCQSTHHSEKTLAETMGFRYRCGSAGDYRDYYLPLLARKRGDGQRFMGCQLSNDYVKNYGWTLEKAEKIWFDRWEDEFSPYLKRLLDEPLESPVRDVLLVFPTYSAAALTENAVHSADTQLIDTTLRMFGCQMVRCGTPKLDKMTIAEMDRFRLIVVPESAYLMKGTYERLRRSKAMLLFTGEFGRALDGVQAGFGGSRWVCGTMVRYYERPAGSAAVEGDHPVTRGLQLALNRQPVMLPADESYELDEGTTLLSCGGRPLLSVLGNAVFAHGHLWAALCWNPNRVPPRLGGSLDSSADEVDGWGPYDSAHPQNWFGVRVMKNILDWAGVDYRVPNPKPRTFVPYLSDHMEQVSISANLVYNNTARPQTVTVRTPYKPRGYPARKTNGRFESQVRVPPFSYVALQPE